MFLRQIKGRCLLLLLYSKWDCVPAAYRPETCRPRCWSGCSWSSLTPSPCRSSLLQRSAPRSLNTTRVSGAMREQSNSTKKLLCIVRLIARSVAAESKTSCVLTAAVSNKHWYLLESGAWGFDILLSKLLIGWCKQMVRFFYPTLFWQHVSSHEFKWTRCLSPGDAGVGTAVPDSRWGWCVPGAMQCHFKEWPVQWRRNSGLFWLSFATFDQ